jgi:hypothetical protein
MMKWLTDHACVRGANLLIPHAFSPKEFPDPDCPPHFRARGMNPQWRHFAAWSAYADRVCRALSGGTHVASAAVLYHAEAEWSGGAYEPFEAVIRDLAVAQIDGDVVPADTLLDETAAWFERGRLAIGGERFGVIVVPYAEMLPSAVLRRLLDAARAGVPVVFRRAFPRASLGVEAGRDPCLAALRRHPRVRVFGEAGLAAAIRRRGLHDVETTPVQPHLRVYHYRTDGRDRWFLVNESLREPVDTALLLRGFRARVHGWDALEDREATVAQRATRAGNVVRVLLEPFESLFLLTEPAGGPAPAAPRSAERARPPSAVIVAIEGPWEASTASSSEYPSFTPAPVVAGPGNVAVPGLLPRFSGTIRYQCRFTVPRRTDARLPAGAGTVLDLGEAYETTEAWLNGIRLGVRICPPYRFDADGALAEGENGLVVEVTNTLVHSHGDNGLDRAMPVDPSGLIGPVRLLG